MQLSLTDDQVLFHETTARFIESELPISRTRDLHDDPMGYDRGWLHKSADLGWFTMLVPEALGGGSVSGDGLADAALVAEEVGRQVQPGPFVPMNVVAAALAASPNADAHAEVLAGIVAGELVATWASAVGDTSLETSDQVVAERSGQGYRLSGRSPVVQDAQSADRLLVVATTEDDAMQILVPTSAAGVSVTPLDSLDLSRRFSTVDFVDVEVPAEAVISVGADPIERALRTAIVLNVAETIGALDAMFTMTVDYAKDRVAFGRPIGSFQAIKHILADQAVYLETCKAASTAATAAVQRDDDAATEVVSMVAAYVADVGNDIAQECLQVHGGIGYTWEHDLHLLMRRVRSNAVLYGTPSWHRERVCSFHRLGEGGAS